MATTSDNTEDGVGSAENPPLVPPESAASTDTTKSEVSPPSGEVNSAPESKQNAEKPAAADKKSKIDVLLKAAGDAPIMKKKKWAVDADKHVSYLTEFIRRFIKCEPSESLFLYVNQTFVPAPDQTLSNLFECFGSDGKLVLHYCKTQAWG